MTQKPDTLMIGVNGALVHLPVTELTTDRDVTFETILELSEIEAIEGAKPKIFCKTPMTRGRSRYTKQGTIHPGETFPLRQGSDFFVRYV